MFGKSERRRLERKIDRLRERIRVLEEDEKRHRTWRKHIVEVSNENDSEFDERLEYLEEALFGSSRSYNEDGEPPNIRRNPLERIGHLSLERQLQLLQASLNSGNECRVRERDKILERLEKLENCNYVDLTDIPDWFPAERYFELPNGNIGIPWEYRVPEGNDWYVACTNNKNNWNRHKKKYPEIEDAYKVSPLEIHSGKRVILKECKPIGGAV